MTDITLIIILIEGTQHKHTVGSVGTWAHNTKIQWESGGQGAHSTNIQWESGDMGTQHKHREN